MRSFFYPIGLLSLLRLAAASDCPVGKIACDSVCATPCDGFVECADRSDETSGLCAGRVCNSTQTNNGGIDIQDVLGIPIVRFKCQYGGCISETFTCNGSPDCWDGSDETSELCSSKTCSNREFRCDYGACIRKTWSCNGNANCVDKSDETEQLCRRKRCRSSQFKCRYGACIPKNERCDGSRNCIDNSDESEEECGPGHTPKPPSPAVTTAPPSPAVTTAPPIPPVVHPPHSSPAPPSQPGDPGIVFTEIPTTTNDSCQGQGLCSCPEPNQHYCVPCNKIQSCAALGVGAVCSIKPAGGPYSQVEVEVLRCGLIPVVSLAGFSRNHEVSYCGSLESVPAESVVLANCWGTDILAQCQADGTWRTYQGDASASPPSPALCQFQEVNSAVCGQRPRFVRAPTKTIHLKAQPQWPWMVGLKKEGTYFCSATIISPHYLLTSAHCVTSTQETSNQVMDPRDVKIQRVSATGDIIKDTISQIHLHPRFTNGQQLSHDVALLRMGNEISFSHQVYPACVHSEHFPAQEIAATFNRTLNEYKWELILQRHDPRCHDPHDSCARSLKIDSRQFCATDTTSSRYLPKGSSGGPYLVNVGSDVKERWVVAGLVSSSYQQASCDRPFTIFTSVKEYWPWILKCAHSGVCS